MCNKSDNSSMALQSMHKPCPPPFRLHPHCLSCSSASIPGELLHALSVGPKHRQAHATCRYQDVDWRKQANWGCNGGYAVCASPLMCLSCCFGPCSCCHVLPSMHNELQHWPPKQRTRAATLASLCSSSPKQLRNPKHPLPAHTCHVTLHVCTRQEC